MQQQAIVKKLQLCYLDCKPQTEVIKNNLLQAICNAPIFTPNNLKKIYRALQFMAAHPQSHKQLQYVKLTFKKLAEPTRKIANKLPDSGLPFTTITTRYSHDMLQWLYNHNACAIALNAFDEEAEDLNLLLKQTLPKILLDFTTIGYSNNELLAALNVSSKQVLPFLLQQFSKLNTLPYSKDYAWDRLNAWIAVTSKQFEFSLPGNVFLKHKVFYHDAILKKVDARAIVNMGLPQPTTLTKRQLQLCINTIKKSLVLTMRETDPVTYLQPETLRYYVLERGIAIAIYGMNGFRQQPLNSYIGYTLIKNGYPAAYGGAWVFGQTAQFGLNVFEHFRGGESTFFLCQLLRVYTQVFQLSEIEIDAYQFGKDNPEGIASGAFWFYYKLGFRPVALKQKKLAAAEFKKIIQKPDYKSSEDVLINLAESNMVWKIKDVKHACNIAIQQQMQALVMQNMANMENAINKQVFTFKNLAGLHKIAAIDELHLVELALLFKVLKISPKTYSREAQLLVQNKTNNPYLYNQVLTELLLAK